MNVVLIASILVSGLLTNNLYGVTGFKAHYHHLQEQTKPSLARIIKKPIHAAKALYNKLKGLDLPLETQPLSHEVRTYTPIKTKTTPQKREFTISKGKSISIAPNMDKNLEAVEVKNKLKKSNNLAEELFKEKSKLQDQHIDEKAELQRQVLKEQQHKQKLMDELEKQRANPGHVESRIKALEEQLSKTKIAQAEVLKTLNTSQTKTKSQHVQKVTTLEEQLASARKKLQEVERAKAEIEQEFKTTVDTFDTKQKNSSSTTTVLRKQEAQLATVEKNHVEDRAEMEVVLANNQKEIALLKRQLASKESYAEPQSKKSEAHNSIDEDTKEEVFESRPSSPPTTHQTPEASTKFAKPLPPVGNTKTTQLRRPAITTPGTTS